MAVGPSTNGSAEKPIGDFSGDVEAGSQHHIIELHGDLGLALVGDRRIPLTDEESRRICRKTDRVILTILVWVYFLQILDKSVLGYVSIFGLQADTGLVGNQYSFLGSIAPIAQLAWQPFSSMLIVKVPHRILMPALLLGWGIAQASMAACHNYPSLLAARFFLGLFEAGCLPLFSIITAQWYRRAEQPMRIAAWFSTNGAATIIGSALSFGLAHIPSPVLRSWQIIFLFVGLVTAVSAPFVYWKLDNDVATARFLTEHERIQAVERLRANQTGIGSRKLKWSHVLEAAIEPKSYLWIGMSLLLNVGASVTAIFGPLILSGFGFDRYITSLLNIPFGAVQMIVIVLACYATQTSRMKFPILIALVLPVLAGLAMLYVLPRTHSNQGALLTAYYFLAFLYGGIPVVVSWIVGNTAGTTKKSVIMSFYNAGASSGNIVGPLLFNSRDAPLYHSGLRGVLAIFVTLVVVVLIQAANLLLLNRLQAKTRIANGKRAVFHDQSMDKHYGESRGEFSMEGEARLGDNAFLDLTDRKNDEFLYIY